MPTLTFRQSAEQRSALDDALAASGLSEQEFVELAVRALAARWNVSYPPASASLVQPPPRPAEKNLGGRPRASDGTHPMNLEVPAGDLELVCPVCRRTFHSDTTMAVFCSDYCKISMRNRRQYLRRKKLKR